jgi:hypothetical protein
VREELVSDYIDIYPNHMEPELCEEIIQRFEEDKRNQYEGVVVYSSGQIAVSGDIKKCTELYLSRHDNWKDIDEIMFDKVAEILEITQAKYKAFAKFEEMIDEGYRIKKYHNDGTEFFDWHVDVNAYRQAHRQMVFLWYLNTVEVGGETLFRTQNVKVKPEQGKLVTFPPFWTHEHMARPPVSSPKYLLAAWATFEK